MLLHSSDHHYGPSSETPFSEDNRVLYRSYATGPDANTPLTQVHRYSAGKADLIVSGEGPADGQEVVYVDGGWDLFSAGHIEVLKADKGSSRYVVLGIHDDQTINKHKGFNYPIMNLKERTLTVLACRVSLSRLKTI
jgi:ethanolamine-phosphate cytidylyltransferase